MWLLLAKHDDKFRASELDEQYRIQRQFMDFYKQKANVAIAGLLNKLFDSSVPQILHLSQEQIRNDFEASTKD